MQIVRLRPDNVEAVAKATNRDVVEVRRTYDHGKQNNKSVYIFIKGPDFWSQVMQHPTKSLPVVDDVLQ